jgi:hypothetical protein
MSQPPWLATAMTTKTPDRFQRAYPRLALGVCMLAFLLAGCSPAVPAPAVAVKVTSEPFRPAPPPVETATQPPTTIEATQSSTKPACLDNLTWVSDVTIPDGTGVIAKSTLDKRWEVKNAGNCNWDDHYRLRLIAGPAMNAPQEQALFPARSGNKAVLQIVFQAPADAGKYRSAWQAYNPDGQPFGDPIFIDIEVK